MNKKSKESEGKKISYNWYIFLALLPILLYSPYAIDPVLQIRYLSLTIMEIIGLYIAIKLYYGKENIYFIGKPFFIAWLIYWLLSFAGFVFNPDLSGDGLNFWFQIFIVGIFPFILTKIYYNSKNYLETVLRLFVITGSIIIINGIYQLIVLFNNETLTHASIYQITGLFAHKNIFSEILILIFPISVVAMLTLKGFWRFLGIAVSAGCLLMIVFLLSRAVWMAFVISSFITIIGIIVIKWRQNNSTILSLGKMKFSILFGIIFIIFGLFILSKFVNRRTIVQQMHDMISPSAYSNKDRLAIWKKTAKISLEHPITGIGMGNWKIEILKEGNKNLESEDNVTFFQRPHNDYLWILSEQGFPALLAYLIAFGFILFFCFKLALNGKNYTDTISYLLINFSIISYLVFSFFSFPKERIEHSVLLGFLFSIIIINYDKKFKSKIPNPKKLEILFIIASLILIITLSIGISRYQSEFHLRKAYEARANSNWLEVISEIDKSYSKEFKMDFVSTPLMWYRGEANFSMNRIDDALNDFKEAEKVNPYHMHVLNNLGTCYEIKGNHNLAINYYKSSLKYTGYFEDALYNLCAVYYNLGQFNNALVTLQKIKPDTLNPKYNDFSLAIINKSIQQISDSMNDPELTKYYMKIKDFPKWGRNVLSKSIKDKRTFENQLLLDIVWVIKEDENNLTFANYLRKKYKLKKD